MNAINTVNPSNVYQRKFAITPKIYVLIVLLIITAITGLNASDSKGIVNAGVAMLTAALLDLLIGIGQQRKRLFPDGGLVTGLIVALVLSSSAPWYVASITTAIALISKHLLKVKRKPIFNPAAFGLLIALYLFSSGQSWWGAFSELPDWSLVLLLIAGFLVTDRVNKFPQVLTFLGTYFGLALMMGLLNNGLAGDLLRNPFINSALFLAFFMLTDPPTSPGPYQGQIIFGLVTALITLGIYFIFGGLSFLLVGLLIANAWNAFKIYRTPSRL